MVLFDVWRESLGMFHPRCLGVLITKTVQLTGRAWTTAFRFWWCFLLLLLMPYTLERLIPSILRTTDPAFALARVVPLAWSIVRFASFVLGTFYSAMMVFGTSSDGQPKDALFFKSRYWLTLPVMVPVIAYIIATWRWDFIMMILSRLFGVQTVYHHTWLTGFRLLSHVSFMTLGWSLSPVFVFFVLNICKQSVKDMEIDAFDAFATAVRFAIYNYPLCAILFAGTVMGSNALYIGLMHLDAVAPALLVWIFNASSFFLFFMPFCVALWTAVFEMLFPERRVLYLG